MTDYTELIEILRDLPHLLFVQLHGHEDIVYQAADAIEELSKLKWIPVTERLPLYGQDVLAVRTYGDGEKCQEVLMAHIALWNEETGEKWWNATNITHWMPLPTPPKGEEK